MIGILLGLWFVAALLIGATGTLRPPFALPPPAVALLLTIIAVMAVWLVPALRARIQKLGVGPMVAFHLTRVAAGIYFLMLASRGTLPGEFALVAGWGDVAVGVAAFPVLMFCVPAESAGQRLGLLIWNTAGLIDILTVLGNGMRMLGKAPEMALPFTDLPLALLPLFVVPLVISTHLWIFTWTARPVQPLPAEPIVRPPEADDV